MSEHMVFQNCSPWQKGTIRSYWSQKLTRIERLLQHFPEDQRELRLTIKHNHDRFHVRAVLLLPTGTLVAESSSQMDNDAIDAVVDKLTMELRRHRKYIRHDDSYRRKHHRRETFRHAAVLLESNLGKPDRETFFEMLRPADGPAEPSRPSRIDRGADAGTNPTASDDRGGRAGRSHPAGVDAVGCREILRSRWRSG